MNAMRQNPPASLFVVRHALPAGDRAHQAEWLARREREMARFGADHRAGYAAATALARQAGGVTFEAVAAGCVHGCWAQPTHVMADYRAVLFVYGGAYCLGDARSYRGLVSQIASRARCPVFALDYPLAPEHPFPAAFDAVRRALDWLTASRYLQVAIVGDSAGGGLALAALADGCGAGQATCAAVFSPWTDLSFAGRSFNDAATFDPVFPERSVLTHAAAQYLDGADATDPRASPLYGCRGRLPPILIQVGGDELLLDDACNYARAAAAFGTPVRLEIYEGMHHVFQQGAGRMQAADDALDRAGDFVVARWT